ncbi:MAG: hypothetical protein ACE5LL_03300 [Alphaproteobacteria bacterium]
MFRDNSLMPKEVIRLAALGTLAQEGRKSYAQLANEVRRFTSHFRGPTLDVMATSIELLRFEGLIDAEEESAGPGETILSVTEAGRKELGELLRANVRAPSGDFNRLVIALKLRFLDLLEPQEQGEQIEALAEICEAELARLIDLRQARAGGNRPFIRWLEHDIGRLEADVVWFRRLAQELPKA